MFRKRRRWKHRNGAGVLDGVGKPASFSNRPEAVLVILRHVPGVHGKSRILRRVVPDPMERFQPVVSGFSSRPFDVWAIRKQLTLRKPHSETQRREQDDPTPCGSLQNVSAQKTATQNNQECVNKVQASHWLKTREGFKR